MTAKHARIRKLGLALVVALALVLGVGKSSATGPANSYTNVVFSDGFESGSLSNWNGLLGNGSATVSGASARTGNDGLGLSNASGQFQVAVKALPNPLVDSSVTFWARFAAGSGFQQVAQTRDGSSGPHMWDLYYDGGSHAFWFYPYTQSGSTGIFTGGNSVPASTWVKVEIQYTATATGGAQIFINDQTQPGWSVSGDYTRSTNLQRLQLWNDGSLATDFDDVTVATTGGAAVAPGAPSNVTGTAGNGQVALSWNAPASNGGSAITGYRITPYIGGVAQTPVSTGSAATSATVTGLTNGTAYTFTVAAVNAVGAGPDSNPSAAITPLVAPTAPGAPTNIFASAGNGSVALGWNAPASDGGRPITSYRITPYIGATAQTPIVTTTAATSYTVTGLTNGTTYTFRVEAINSVGIGTASAPSSAVTPSMGYSNVVFADGFESGTLANWDGAPGTGTSAVAAGNAHAGSYGLGLTNTTGQYAFLAKGLPSPLTDSQTSFWVRLGTGSGLETIAQARDGSSSLHMWDLYYDWTRQGFVLDGYMSSGVNEVFTGVGSVASGSWVKVAVNYTEGTTGSMQLFVNGATRADWGGTGNFTRTADLQRIQLWNDAVGATSFDDVRVATPTPVGAVLPGAPSAVTGTSRDRAVALNWAAPASDGGSPISGYQITPSINGTAQTPIVLDYPVTSYTVSGLTNGTAYTFRVAAINGVGTGASSTASTAVTPAVATVPGTPTNVTGASRDGAATVQWTAPADGGTPITGWWITPYVNGTAQSPTISADPTPTYTVTGLTNGTGYTFKVSAVNSVGRGPDSAASAVVTPRAALSEYTNNVFFDGLESGDLSNWSAPQGPGTATAAPAAAHTGAYGLRIATLETQYAYVAKTFSGPVADSLTSFWVRLGTGTRTVTVAQARDGGSTMMWQLLYDSGRHGFYFYPYTATSSTELFTGVNSAPAATWVRVTVQYKATAQGQAQLYLNGQTQSAWGVSGDLTHSTNYQRLLLWNEGLPDIDFDDVSVATVAPVGATPPGAPTGASASALDRAASVTWTAPASDGGSPITGYRVTTYTGGVAQSVALTGSAATNYRVGALTNGTPYTFTVAALNAAGAGPESDPSAPVTPVPAPPPGPPTGVSATAGNTSVALSWTAPASDGGSPITSYRITPYASGAAQTAINTGSNATTRTITGLTNGVPYTFTVAATNSSGTGNDSGASNAVTPQAPTAPPAPTGLSGSPRDSAVALNWTAPTSDGGSAITNYRVTPYVNGVAQTAVSTGSTATGYTIGGLTNGTAYTFTVAAVNAIGTGSQSAATGAITPAVPPANPIVLENRQQGTTSWHLDIDQKAENHEIEGYAGATSVNKGGQIQMMVNLSTPAQFTMDIYRLGWYPQGTNPDGTSCAPSCGGRLMQHVGPLNGIHQANCPQVTTQNDPNFGMTECNWTPSYTLTVPTSWTTGNYIVKLKRADGRQLESYMTFVVRDDASTAPVLYSMDVATWQAYNFWGGAGNNNVGYDLYSRFNDVTGDPTGGRAYTVSFDRPYAGEGSTDGSGLLLNWDFPMIRYLESKGYDISYVTSLDLETNPNLLVGHKVFVNTGHDEYYSDNMRTAVTNGLSAGVNLALFSANNFYFRTQYQPSAGGTPNRRQHCDKNALPGSTTYEWRLVAPTRTENTIGGVMLLGIANDRPYLVSDASSWIYGGTGLKTYTGNGTTGVVTSGANQNALPGIVGYEFDARASTTASLSSWAQYEPPGVQSVGHSFVPAADGNATNVYHDATLYTAPSGATVFSAGTIDWSWGVDDGYNDGYCNCFHGYTNPATQRITQNIVDRLSSSP